MKKTSTIDNRQSTIVKRLSAVDNSRLRYEITSAGRRNRQLAMFCLLFTVCSLLTLTGCTISFKGGSVPAHLKTIAIPIVEDQSGFGDALLATTFTQQLTARFVSDNSLRLTDKNSADSELDGVIIQVSDAPSILQGVETVSARRVTIQVHVTFQDVKLRKKIWDKTFSDWGDYASGNTLTQREVGIQTALQKLEDDILNETVAGW
ncbi:MAG: LPS assembly lipoprotein LptE [Bacteroidota bacterium]